MHIKQLLLLQYVTRPVDYYRSVCCLHWLTLCYTLHRPSAGCVWPVILHRGSMLCAFSAYHVTVGRSFVTWLSVHNSQTLMCYWKPIHMLCYKYSTKLCENITKKKGVLQKLPVPENNVVFVSKLTLKQGMCKSLERIHFASNVINKRQ